MAAGEDYYEDSVLVPGGPGNLPIGNLPLLTGMTGADPALADELVGYDASATANRKFQADRLLGLARLAPGGRLTLTSGTPVTTSDVTGATSVYYTPFVDDMICLWDGTRWVWITFAEYTLSLGTLTSGKPYDIFAYLSGGALAAELLVWTSDTARATAVTVQDGRYCKSGDKTRLLLGTIYTTATTTTEDSAAKRYVSNAYNAVPRHVFTNPGYTDDNANTSYTHTGANFAEINGGTNNRVNFLLTLPAWFGGGGNWTMSSSATGAITAGVGVDTATDPYAVVGAAAGPVTVFGAWSPIDALLAAGKHYCALLARMSAGTGTIFSDAPRGGAAVDPRYTHFTGSIFG